MWECEWWENFKTKFRTRFPYKRSLSTDYLLTETKKIWIFFGFVLCNLVVPGELKLKYANFPPIFKNTPIPPSTPIFLHFLRILISSLKLENGTVVTPLFNFYLELGLQRTKIYRFVQYILVNVSIISFNTWLMREEKEMKTF